MNGISIVIVNSLNTGSDSDRTDADDESSEVVTDNTPFIGVAGQSKAKSVVSYYGIENHFKWIFTPLFRGATSNVPTGTNMGGTELPAANVSR